MILCPHTEYQVCFPTLVTDCELEEGGQSVELYTEQHCTEVTINIHSILRTKDREAYIHLRW